MEVLVKSSVKRPGMTLVNVRRLAEQVLRAEGRTDVEVGILLVGRRAMTTLNERYTRRRGVTDVLSFEMAGREFSGSVLGDVYVCADEARAQAKSAGEPIGDSVARLVIHGLLHMVGYDHTKSHRAARAMEERQEVHGRAWRKSRKARARAVRP
ncbi:MAG: rRNA maturation RNase YbeY [Candidatus Eisenbacteria sp.]|nr:rRNA maturation RNase YbeY [Candidatus Eisenbacteria bacterium]